MSDLISRKETERLLRAYADEVGCNRGQYELANGILKAVCYLDNIPTAYNLESVIEQFENKIKTVRSEEYTKDKFQNDSIRTIIINVISDLEEIIKSGTTATNGKNGG